MKHFHPPGRSKGPTAFVCPTLRIPGCCRGRWRRFGHREQLRKRAWDPICFQVPISCKKIRLHFVGILFFPVSFIPGRSKLRNDLELLSFQSPGERMNAMVFFVELLQCIFGLRRFGATCLVASGMIFSSGMQSLPSGRPSELDGTQFNFQVRSVFGDFKLTRWAGLQLLEST